MADLVQKFNQENKTKKIVLLASVVAFLGMFFPWLNENFIVIVNVSVSQNGWSGWGNLTGIAAFVLVAWWALVNLEIKISLPIKEDVLQKSLVVLMLVGAAVSFLNFASNDGLSYIGVGLYISLIASAVAAYCVFTDKFKIEKVEEKPIVGEISEGEIKK